MAQVLKVSNKFMRFIMSEKFHWEKIGKILHPQISCGTEKLQ